MQPLDAADPRALANVEAVLADIDDTMTTNGRITATALAAMERLTAAGVRVVPVTGRPAGWCDHIARMWPVDAVVGENGAFWFRYDAGARRVERHYHDDARTRAENRERLTKLGTEILAAVPGAAIASDQPYREADLAIDYCEDVDRLSDEDVGRIVEMFEAAGAVAKVSSIHVNGWFGDYDKLAMTRRLFADAFGTDLDAEPERVMFIGDSPNDAPMFAHFPLAVGVANVRDFEARLAHKPAFVTPSDAGAGFAEAADAVIGARG